MGKHKKTSQRGDTSAKFKNIDEVGKKLDLLTSHLIDLCGQRPSTQQSPGQLWKEHLEIREKLNEIRTIQKDQSTSVLQFDSNRGDRLKLMTDWCMKNGLHTNGVSITSVDGQDGNYGLIADKSIDVGELIAKVPQRLFLSLENIIQRNDAIRTTFEKDPMLKGMPNVALSLIVAMEKLKGVDSFWYPYLNSLPVIHSTPLCALVDGPENFGEVLRGSIALEEALKLYRNIVRQYAYFYQMLSSSSPNFASIIANKLLPKEKFVFDLYLWAAVTVMTRINFVPSFETNISSSDEKRAMVPALIPYFDMANHGDVPPCTDFMEDQEDASRHSAVIYASKSYQHRNDLLIFYGERKYWEFFVHNGFVYDDGKRYPNITVKMGLSTSDRLSQLKTSAMQRYGLQPSEQFVVSKYASKDGSVPLRQFAMVFCSDETELRAFCSDQRDPQEWQWSAKTIDEAKKFLLTRLALLLRTYSTPASGESTSHDVIASPIASNANNTDDRIVLASRFIQGEIDSLKNAITILESCGSTN